MVSDLSVLCCAVIAALGIVQSAGGLLLLRRHRRRHSPAVAFRWPAVTVLKPLYGDEMLLEAALASFCRQDYPDLQIVFGVQSAGDPALPIVQALQRRFPHVAIDIVVDGARHGRNGKVGNLLNMVRVARNEVIVIADSDIHAEPTTLRSVVAALQRPGVGLVTTLYTGLPATPSLAGALGAAYINHTFLPGALLARSMGRQDCLGAIMTLERRTLERIGGLEALSDHLADDALLGRLVRAQGLSIALADAIPATTVPETTLPALIAHELRWMRTIKSVAPVGFILSVFQYPLFWATLMLLADPDDPYVWLGVAGMWLLRGILAQSYDRLLHTTRRLPMWCLPFRDVLSVATMVASYGSNRVAWRGQEYRVTSFSEAVLQPGKG